MCTEGVVCDFLFFVGEERRLKPHIMALQVIVPCGLLCMCQHFRKGLYSSQKHLFLSARLHIVNLQVLYKGFEKI